MLIGLNCRKQFKKWKLYERQAFFWTTVIYEIQGLVRMERYFEAEDPKIMHEKVHELIRYLFREYEYYWQQLTARQIAYLLWVDHTTVDRILKRIEYRIKEWFGL